MVLEINNLNYGSFQNINLSFANKKFYSIVGGNNSGKTTLFKLMTGFIPSNNCITCNGVFLNSNSINDYIQNIGIASVVNDNTFIYQKVKDEMMYPLYNLGYSKRKIEKRINEVVNLFDVNFINKNINELTSCERQVLLIMLAILHKPKVLILDNVFNIFFQDEEKKLLSILRKLIEKENITIINLTSSLNSACFSDRIILLSDFKIIGEYLPSDIYNDDKLFYQNGLEIPFIVDLSVKLKMYGLIDNNYTNIEKMVDDIWP